MEEVKVAKGRLRVATVEQGKGVHTVQSYLVVKILVSGVFVNSAVGVMVEVNAIWSSTSLYIVKEARITLTVSISLMDISVHPFVVFIEASSNLD